LPFDHNISFLSKIFDIFTLRFNKKKEDETDTENRLTLLDTAKIDDHSRITFTKRIREIFDVKIDDLIIAYRDNTDKYNKLIFKIQRDDRIIDTWILKRDKSIRKNDEKSILNNKDNREHNVLHNKKFTNILLVEDEEDTLFTVKEILINSGYTVKTFTDSKSALYHLIEINKNNKNYYDLIITDIRMPNINGIQLYQILNILEPDSKILFITGLDTLDEIYSLIPAIKSQNVLKKPFGSEHLLQRINDIFLF
jgi:CheY-like chemotaxis protein